VVTSAARDEEAEERTAIERADDNLDVTLALRVERQRQRPLAGRRAMGNVTARRVESDARDRRRRMLRRYRVVIAKPGSTATIAARR